MRGVVKGRIRFLSFFFFLRVLANVKVCSLRKDVGNVIFTGNLNCVYERVIDFAGKHFGF